MAYVDTRPSTVRGGRIAPLPTSSARNELIGHADAILRGVDRTVAAERLAAKRLVAKPEFWTSASGTRPPDPGPRPHPSLMDTILAHRAAAVPSVERTGLLLPSLSAKRTETAAAGRTSSRSARKVIDLTPLRTISNLGKLAKAEAGLVKTKSDACIKVLHTIGTSTESWNREGYALQNEKDEVLFNRRFSEYNLHLRRGGAR